MRGERREGENGRVRERERREEIVMGFKYSKAG